jgi:uncharacterized protein
MDLPSGKKTLVLGASSNPERYSYLAAVRLRNAGHPVIAVGARTGSIEGIPILTSAPETSDIDTVTLYLGPGNQAPWTDYLLRLKPRRVLFNPGTENADLEEKLTQAGISSERVCTLVLLSAHQY